MTELTLERVDRDEALLEAVAELYGSTRAGFLRGAALGGAAMLLDARRAARRGGEVSDVAILQLRAAVRAPAGDVLHAGGGARDDRAP